MPGSFTGMPFSFFPSIPRIIPTSATGENMPNETSPSALPSCKRFAPPMT